MRPVPDYEQTYRDELADLADALDRAYRERLERERAEAGEQLPLFGAA